MGLYYKRIIILLTLIGLSIENCYDRPCGFLIECNSFDHVYVLHCYMVIDKLESSHPNEVFKIEIYASNILNLVPELFDDFINVKSIILMGNNLTKIAPGTFRHLPQLTYLNLTNNNIISLPQNISRGLRTLIASKNKISTITRNIVENMNPFGVLDLSYNNIYDVTPLMENCGTLVYLDISHNYIDKIEFTTNCKTLYSLYASENNISRFIANTTLSMDLKQLKLSHNNLNIIELKQFSNLAQLDLSNNPLFAANDLPVGIFQNKEKLHFLNLSSTRIQNLITGAFSKMTNLATLDLSHNSISILPKGIFHDLISLRNLYLNNNHLTYLYYDGLGNLLKISLDNNLWNCDVLSNIITKLRSKNVEIITGSTYNSSNIFGVNCMNLNVEKSVRIQPQSNQLEEEHYSFMDNIDENFQHILLRQESLFNLSAIYQQNQSHIFWTRINRDYQNFSKKLLKDFQKIAYHLTRATSSIKKLMSNSTISTTTSKMQNDTLTHILLLQKKYLEILKEDREDFFEQAMSKFEGVLVEVKNALNQTINYIKNNFSASESFPKNNQLDRID